MNISEFLSSILNRDTILPMGPIFYYVYFMLYLEIRNLISLLEKYFIWFPICHQGFFNGFGTCGDY
jgi:hypothetical protein